jgi:chromate transporter
MNTKPSVWETFHVFLKLGLTCFGGPIAHLGYFREEFVVRRKWLDDHAFADTVALCQFLPGPASSKVGMIIGMHRAGWMGALVAWIGFTAPSAMLMTAFALGITRLGDVSHAGWLNGLKLAAVAVVAQAVWAMASKFCIERITATIALLGALTILAWPSGLAQILVIALGSFFGWLFFRHQAVETKRDPLLGKLTVPFGRRQGALMLGAFFLILLTLPALTAWTHNSAVASFDSFYRSGALVFGGGHVVLPLLHAGVVDPGWVSDDQFLAGYGVVQAVPGPLFSFAAYLGAVMKPQPNDWLGALWCLVAIFVPAALVGFGALPFWEKLKGQTFARSILRGANASVVAVLLAALYRPVWTSAVHRPLDLVFVLAGYGLLALWAWPPWLVVASAALGGALL